MRCAFLMLCLVPLVCFGQTPKDVRAVAKQGQAAVPKVAEYLNSASVDTRIEAVKQLTALGGKDSRHHLRQS